MSTLVHISKVTFSNKKDINKFINKYLIKLRKLVIYQIQLIFTDKQLFETTFDLNHKLYHVMYQIKFDVYL